MGLTLFFFYFAVTGSFGFFFTGFYWVLLIFFMGCNGFQWVPMGFNGFYWVLLGFSWVSMGLLGFTGFQWVSRHLIRFESIFLGETWGLN